MGRKLFHKQYVVFKGDPGKKGPENGKSVPGPSVPGVLENVLGRHTGGPNLRNPCTAYSRAVEVLYLSFYVIGPSRPYEGVGVRNSDM